jgi:proline iminopeptidase
LRRRRRGRRLCRAEFIPEEASSSGVRPHVLPKSGHALNLEEPALFNETVERFIGPVEAKRWSGRDPRSVLA